MATSPLGDQSPSGPVPKGADPQNSQKVPRHIRRAGCGGAIYKNLNEDWRVHQVAAPGQAQIQPQLTATQPERFVPLGLAAFASGRCG